MRIIAILISIIFFGSTVSALAGISPRSRHEPPREGLMLESQIDHLGIFVKSRVLLEVGSAQWVKIGEGTLAKARGLDANVSDSRFIIEARATMMDAEVAEVETRVRGLNYEENGKLLVRLGEYAMITTAQMETLSGNKLQASAGAGQKMTKLGVRVVKVRY
jgi:hypothetical protein